MNRDRIAEVYDGVYGDEYAQSVARERIHWMCARVEGEEVLDVGCSQGIASFLLAREGKRVVGIDREHVALEEAMERLRAEQPEVRRRVRFEHGQASSLPMDDGSVDTVLLGEVLEHLIDRDAALAEASRVLRPDGVLIITTPYGIHPHHDHKQPVYLRELLDRLVSRFAIVGLELVARYLAVVVRKAEPLGYSTSTGWSEALDVAETRLFELDHLVEDQRQRLTRLNQQIKAGASVREELERSATTNALLEQRLADTEADVSRAKERAQVLDDEQADRVAALELGRDSAVRQTQQLGEELAGLREGLAALERQVGDATQREETAVQQLEVSRRQLADRSRRAEELDRELGATRARMTERVQSHEEALAAQVATSRSEVIAAQQGAADLAAERDLSSARVASLESEIHDLRDREREAVAQLAAVSDREDELQAALAEVAVSQQRERAVAEDRGRLRHELREQRQAVESGEAAVAFARERISVVRAERDQLRRGLRPQLIENDRLRAEAQRAGELAEEAGRSATRIEELELLLHTSSAQLSSLSRDRASSKARQEDLLEELRDAEATIAGKQEERDLLATRSAELLRQLQDLNRQVRDLEEALESREAQAARDQTSLATLRDEVDHLEHTVAETQDELDRSVARLDWESQQRARLRSELVNAQSQIALRSELLHNLLASRAHRVLRRSRRFVRRASLPVSVLAVAAAAVLIAVGSAAAGIAVAAFALLSLCALLAALRIAPKPRSSQPAPTSSFIGAYIEPEPPSDRPHAPGEAESPRGAQVSPAASAVRPGIAPVPSPRTPAASAGTLPQVRITAAQPQAATVVSPSPADAVRDARRRWLARARELQIGELKVAAVMDEMSRACFAPECQLFTFGMDDWKEKLEQEMPDFLLVESAWSGNDGRWQYGVASYTHPHYKGLPQLRSLIAWCRERGVPTAFWNKEDPIHFDRFAEAAALFDHVFTTDENCIPRYEALPGNQVKSVLALPFAAQPRIHNPIRKISERHREPVFAGTYYRDRHLDRRKSLEVILDAARPLGLIIYDRTFGTDSEAYGFPERFLPHVKGRLPYEKVIDVYKTHKVFLNVNSVTDSPTMFSRRVFELLACDTAVVSTESVGIESMFGDLVPIVTTLEDATRQISRLIEDDDFRGRLLRKARRLVLSRDNYTERLAFVATAVGINVTRARESDVAALISVDRSVDVLRFDELIEDILGQSRKPSEVVIDLPEGGETDGPVQRLRAGLDSDAVKLVTRAEADHPVELATVAGLSATPWVAPLRIGTHYGKHHLADLTACTSYAEADVIAAAVALNGAAPPEHTYSDCAHPNVAIAKRKLVSVRGWPTGVADDRFEGWFSSGVRFYTADEPDRSEE